MSNLSRHEKIQICPFIFNSCWLMAALYGFETIASEICLAKSASFTYLLEMGLLLYALIMVFFLAVLWRVSSVARCWIKYIVFGLVSVFSACAPIPIMLLRPRDSRNAL
ncbi:hypothetical protein NQ317_010304 [Molorchus minor]|uniref:Uncharacterized protein n=1 Tax=Molorchus minor TaxID=1323400 RepID=A0ABQ9JLG0_9CUCU|nr:hypothetical protein NQ317_010304 [Molorchus minor]